MFGLRLSDDDLDRQRAHMTDPSAARRAGADDWTEAIACAVTDGTFFTVGGDHAPVVTTRGTRPGSSWADVLFAVVIRRVLERRNSIRDAWAHESPSHPMGWLPKPGTLPEQRSVCEDNRHVAGSMGPEVVCTADAFLEHGSTLSYGPLKTAIMAAPAGHGSRAVKQHLFGAAGCAGELPFLLEGARAVRVPLIPSYKYLGSMQMPRGGMKAEIAYRAAQAFAAFAQGRRKVFRVPQISVARKAFTLRASVLPKLLFGVGSWAPLTGAEHRQFAGVLWRLYRPLLGLRYQQDQDVSFHTCLAIVGLPSPDTTLKMQRLLYLGQMMRHWPDALWALLRADRPHSSCLLEACRWLLSWMGPAAALPDPGDDWRPWHDMLLDQPGRFKGMVKRAVKLQGVPACCHRGPLMDSTAGSCSGHAGVC